MLTFAGHEVEREYYLNDAGGQMDLFGRSVEARYLQLLGRDAAMPEDGYHGEYVTDSPGRSSRPRGRLADLPPEERAARLREERRASHDRQIRATLERFGIPFDTYFSRRRWWRRARSRQRSSFSQAGSSTTPRERSWFRSTEFGDDKDRVLIRPHRRAHVLRGGLAYVLDKFSRGFDRLVYVWGADHHGDVRADAGCRDRARLRPRPRSSSSCTSSCRSFAAASRSR